MDSHDDTNHLNPDVPAPNDHQAPHDQPVDTTPTATTTGVDAPSPPTTTPTEPDQAAQGQPAPQPQAQPQPQPQPHPHPFSSFFPFLPAFQGNVAWHFSTFAMPAATPPTGQGAAQQQPAASPTAGQEANATTTTPSQAGEAPPQSSPGHPMFGPERPPHPEPHFPGAMPDGSAVPPQPTMPQPHPQGQDQPHAHAHTWQVPGGMMFTVYVGPVMPGMPGMPAPGPTGEDGAPGPQLGQPQPGQQGPPGMEFFPFLQFPPWFFFPQPQMQEKEPDYARSSLLMRALEVVDPELRARWERVEGEQVRCAVCFEGLGELPGVDEEQPAAANASEQPDAQPAQDQHAHQARKNRVPVCPFPQSESLSLPCHHTFHAACLFPWLAEHTTCPTCRFDLDPQSLTLSLPTQPQPAGGDRYRPYPSQETRKPAKWQLPAPPSGATLREFVAEREHQQGWTCSDPSCLHTIPLPAYSLNPGQEPKAEQIHLLASLDLESGPVCEHAYHPECLVGSVKARGEEPEQATGGLRVECGMCRGERREGWVMREVWDAGVKAWEEI